MSFPSGSVVKISSANAGNTGNVGLMCGLEIPHGGGNGNPLQYSCLDNPMDRAAWRSMSMCWQRVTCDWARARAHTHTHTHKSLFISSYFLWSEVYLLISVFKLFIFSQFLMKQGISLYLVICFVSSLSNCFVSLLLSSSVLLKHILAISN